MLCSFFFNHKMETLLDCIRWQRFLWLRKKLYFECQKQAPALRVLPLWFDLELLKVSLAEERTCCFFVCLVKILFLPIHTSSSGSSCCLVCWLTLWVGTTLRVFWSTIVCHLFNISNITCLLSGFSCVQLFATLWTGRFLNPGNPGPSGSFVHGILQARILECVAMPSFGGSSLPQGSKHLALVAGSACQCKRQKRGRFHPSVGKIP